MLQHKYSYYNQSLETCNANAVHYLKSYHSKTCQNIHLQLFQFVFNA